MRPLHLIIPIFVLLLAGTAAAENCSQPTAALTHIKVPAHPFSVVESKDGCWLFVSIASPNASHGIAVVSRAAGHFAVKRVVEVPGNPFGMAMTHDGKLLVVTAVDSLSFLDVQALIRGRGNALLGTMRYAPADAQPIYANITPDDRFALVSDEHAERITVIDLGKARATRFSAAAILGAIPTGYAPIALTFSPDGKLLYSTSEVADKSWNWPLHCKTEGRNTGDELTRPEGAILVVDVAKAETTPAEAVVARAPAGCSPVRLAVTPDGKTVWVTARNNNAVLAFDTAKLVSDPDRARAATVAVGPAPVGIAVFDQGRRVLATNSNRFAAANANQVLNVIDTQAALAGKAALLGTIEAGSFPREIGVSRDGSLIFVSNWASDTVEVLDVQHLPLQATSHPQ